MADSRTSYYLPLLVVLSTYFIASKYVFDKVNSESGIIIDELFHLPQGQLYCNRNFTYWDPKITTLPGLYIVSSALVGPYFDCTVYNLRFVNLLASCINLLLFSSILKYVYFNDNLKIVLQALSLALLPPLYFFSYVYYSDTLSITFLLAFSRLCLTNRYKFLMFIFGAFSILMRQTNIAWIAMVFGHKFLDIFIKSSRVFGNVYITNIKLSKTSLIAQDVDSSKVKRYYDLGDVFQAMKYHLGTYFRTFFKFLIYQDFVTLLTHCILLISFVVFVYINGSIVVGDKKAHEATLHLPQLFYFSLFYGFFGLPYALAKLGSTLKLIFSQKLRVFLLIIVCLVIVHFNTITHPYLLADNRHFTFYIWNRWFGKYEFAKYATVPVYVFLFYSLYDNLRDQNCISFLLPYSVSTILVLALQKLIEVRYFLVPYIILRLRFVRPSYKIVIFEFLWYVLINVAAFHVFFSRAVYWKDFDDAQRIIW
ncbi:putative Dol-P-Glc:Glc(2)Man(9)GlcNAc(2)-PP-Dol alpha-1,2-glucosyltransferase [Manduca sexta]|uniref:putative Dol-P-Glc:Glc(2)Man(9)GlcNAc(2)-PP-Dol alpha-1,2-glucosyltransferase n=1 Tax=Manduca sexta TaxID=7130 RepID=UPI00189090C2|nr:putative Dol-P-Glc:Glc(2)Man(9)GlcNAc(2)-PP-Dol alpha-1,2-glucosyltransferase [Manduca sexta]XP_037299380.1 putative Dol-P-Glc:Glc(2)Man(9)GlcNAc(2)-PP-Dol alpha-1,2-glucosyltransferase [Manduca sexta]